MDNGAPLARGCFRPMVVQMCTSNPQSFLKVDRMLPAYTREGRKSGEVESCSASEGSKEELAVLIVGVGPESVRLSR
jgi:hypothetical protein